MAMMMRLADADGDEELGALIYQSSTSKKEEANASIRRKPPRLRKTTSSSNHARKSMVNVGQSESLPITMRSQIQSRKGICELRRRQNPTSVLKSVQFI